MPNSELRENPKGFRISGGLGAWRFSGEVDFFWKIFRLAEKKILI
jgi:hypothetical protein